MPSKKAGKEAAAHKLGMPLETVPSETRTEDGDVNGSTMSRTRSTPLFHVFSEKRLDKTDGQSAKVCRDASGAEYYLDGNGDVYYLDEHGVVYYLDEKGDVYYLDENGRVYYLNENGEAFYYDEDGECCFFDPSEKTNNENIFDSVHRGSESSSMSGSQNNDAVSISSKTEKRLDVNKNRKMSVTLSSMDSVSNPSAMTCQNMKRIASPSITSTITPVVIQNPTLRAKVASRIMTSVPESHIGGDRDRSNFYFPKSGPSALVISNAQQYDSMSTANSTSFSASSSGRTPSYDFPSKKGIPSRTEQSRYIEDTRNVASTSRPTEKSRYIEGNRNVSSSGCPTEKSRYTEGTRKVSSSGRKTSTLSDPYRGMLTPLGTTEATKPKKQSLPSFSLDDDTHPLSMRAKALCDDKERYSITSSITAPSLLNKTKGGGIGVKVAKLAPLDPEMLFKGDVSTRMSETGSYSYLSLVAVSLYRLYNYAPWQKEFVQQTVETLGKHLQQPQSVVEAAHTVSRGDGLNETKPLLACVQQEAIVQSYGEEVLIFDLISVILRQGVYDARSRSLLKYMSGVLLVKWERVEQYETHLVETFMEQEHTMSEEEKTEKREKERSQKLKKYALIGVATIGGGALLGLTGGLAAPLIAAGAGAIIGGTGAAALGSVAGIYIIGSLFGVAGAGLAGFKMNKRVGDLEEFEFEPLTEGCQLHVTVAISGWLTEKNPDFHTAWRGLANSEEQYVLRYESKYLQQVGSAMDYIMEAAIKSATAEALKYTVLSVVVTGIMAAVVWPAALVTASSIIDNPWSVVMSRSALAGKQLANVLLARHQGKRPVTLIGFSLGARVIYYCLQELAERKNCEGIIEEAIMLGTPVTRSSTDWKKMERVVSGRIINGYCGDDWLLKFLYRTASIQYTIAGLGPIDWHDRHMHNIDLTNVVDGHMDYLHKIDEILEIVGIRTKTSAYTQSMHNLCDFKKGNISMSKMSLKSMDMMNDI